MITLLDPQQDVDKPRGRESALFRDQIETADVLVLNRCDLASEEEILRVEEWAEALAPPKLRIVRASHGVLPDEIWDLEPPAAPAGNDPPIGCLPRTTFMEISRGIPWKGMWALASPIRRSGSSTPTGSWLALERLPGRQRLTKGRVARAKGIFHTTAGWRVHEIAGGRLTTEAHRPGGATAGWTSF